MRLLLLVCLASACYSSPDLSDRCNIACTDACPDDMKCVAGFCRPTDDTANTCDPGGTNRRFTKISAGERHACAIDIDGLLVCWGANDHGQVTGIPGIAEQIGVNVIVDGVSTWADVAAGATHTCAIGNPGDSQQIFCWGDNAAFQSGSPDPGATGPTLVELTTGVAAELDAGQQHTCIVTTEGALFCWGTNNAGQLTGAAQASPSPLEVPSANPRHRWTHVSAGGDTTCATNDGGETYCWGDNAEGQLGTGQAVRSSSIPALVPLDGVEAISVGREHVCANLPGELRCWGGNIDGKVGVDNTANDNETMPVEPAGSGGTPGWSDVESGGVMSCAIQDGQVFCWGGNESRSALGDGECCRTTFGPVADRPVAPPPGAVELTNAFEISLGAEFGCALFGDVTNGGVARCWGDNSSGQLANARQSVVPTATAVAEDGPWSVVRLGRNHGCAIKSDDKSLWCWGDNLAGQVDPTSTDLTIAVPVEVPGVGEAIDVALGRRHTCVLLAGNLMDANRVVCWGSNAEGQLGQPAATGMATPVLIGGDWIGIVAAKDTTCVVAATESATQCWGAQPGWTMVPMPVPRVLSGDEQLFTVIRLGDDSACSANNGGLLCAGPDSNGMRGDGPGTPPPDGPTAVVVGMNALMTIVEHTDAAAESTHRCAVDGLGQTFCWGNNDHHQVRPETTPAFVEAIDVTLPDGDSFIVDVTSVEPTHRRIAAGKDFTCAVHEDRHVFCWGNNAAMQLTSAGQPDGVVREIAVDGAAEFRTISAGTAFACGIRDGGDLLCWGNSRLGEAGSGDSDQNHFVDVRAQAAGQ